MSSSNHHTVPAIWSKVTNGVHEEKHASDSSSDEEPQARMRVGEMYQAKVPAWQESASKSALHSKEGMLIWSPDGSLPDEKLNAYCQVAKEKHSYNVEQALGMLFWHKHDITKSLIDMSNFTPMPDEWSMEDKVLFEQAYTFHGKNFRKIQQLIPDKEIGQLVKHYYSWKKTRTKTSLMDRQAAKRHQENDSDESPADEDEGQSMDMDTQQAPPRKSSLDTTVKHKLPKGIHLNTEDIEEMANHANGAEGCLDELDNKLIELKKQVQIDKQECGTLNEKLQGLPEPPEEAELSDEWTDNEANLVVKGIEKFGENLEVIAEILGTKAPSQVKTMLATRRDELNIDQVLERKENETGGN